MLRWAELRAEAGQSDHRGQLGPAKSIWVGDGGTGGWSGRPGGSGLLLLLLSGGGVKAPIEAGLQVSPPNDQRGPWGWADTRCAAQVRLEHTLRVPVATFHTIRSGIRAAAGRGENRAGEGPGVAG